MKIINKGIKAKAIAADSTLNINKSEYNELISSSYLTLLLHPKSFKYRFSGVILDSLFNKKGVVSNDFHIARLFNKK